MFGMGGFGMGGFGRGGNSTYRKIRIAAIVVLLGAGLLLHRHGSTYSAIRAAYLVLIVGGLIWSMSRRRAGVAPGRRGGNGVGSRMGNPTSMPGSPAAPGWYPEPGSAATQRYWDGVAWGGRRRWDGSAWIPE